MSKKDISKEVSKLRKLYNNKLKKGVLLYHKLWGVGIIFEHNKDHFEAYWSNSFVYTGLDLARHYKYFIKWEDEILLIISE